MAIDVEKDLKNKISEKKKNKSKEQEQESPTPLFRKAETTCKSIAWFIIIGSAAFHFYRLFLFEYAGQTCPLLFESGHWIGNKWQPDGCMMHEYIQSEIKTCLQNKKVALIGDSRTRSLYFQLANSVSQEPVPTGYHEDLKYTDRQNTSIDFYWLPMLNEDVNLLLKSWIQKPSILPDLIIMGVATWRIKDGELTAIVDYQEELKKLAASISYISKNLTFTNVLNTPDSRFHHEPQLLWIMQDPVVESKLAERRKKITNEKIEMYNYGAEKTLRTSSPYIHLLKSTPIMAAGRPEESVDGLHYSSFILEKKVDVVLNAFCNNYIYPDDASCCKDLEKITQLQFNAFAVLATCVILWLMMYICRKIRDKNVKKPDNVYKMCRTTGKWQVSRRRRQISDLTEYEITRYEMTSVLPWLYLDHMYEAMRSMAKLAAIMLYIFLADSSLLYNKDHKRYSHLAFFIPLVGLLITGLLTRAPVKKLKLFSLVGCLRRIMNVTFSRKKGTSQDVDVKKQTTILNTEQVEEWKGWMVIVVMLYNYTHAEEVLPVFVNVRLLISSFLFMIGFIHFRQFWYENDFGLYKICKVLAHLNVFCVALCLVMGHSYQHYYLVSLLSFWFFIVYLSMSWFPRITHQDVVNNSRNYYWMTGKLVVLFVVVFVIWAHENVCEWIFSRKMIRELFANADGHVQQWRFNSGLHRYSVVFGMLCAFIYVTLKRYDIIKDEENVDTVLPSKTISFITLVLAGVGLVGYEVQAFTCHSQALCDHTHPLASCLPEKGASQDVDVKNQILSYVLLRNLPGWLRAKHSVFFAWVGNMSIELFIGQYHIWLSNDTHGIHVLIPGYPTINALVTSFTFVCVIHEVKKVSSILAEQLVTKDVRIMLRRLVIFIIALVIIWWHKTHEKRPS